eukprot:TRINITY_DN1700_c0_g2_i1.p1 TRINITY_DN1700_c0_g2~~TRINITY_DN1700_c0_g2_i1.p1  ORF type:complete len:296 (+),score=17.71 TRINITY_DN1700_c0_g2_i1:50-937(+)
MFKLLYVLVTLLAWPTAAPPPRAPSAKNPPFSFFPRTPTNPWRPAPTTPRRRAPTSAPTTPRRRAPTSALTAPRRRFVQNPRRRDAFRRRTSDGWTIDDSRRRGYSGTAVAAAAGLGFIGGIATGSAISSPQGTYYHHELPWTDMYGVVHPSGYYTEQGYYYKNEDDFGYAHATRTTSSSGSSLGTLLLIVCCLGTCCCLPCYCSGRGEAAPPIFTELPTFRNGPPVSDEHARGFLSAAVAEYCNDQHGAVGQWASDVGLNEQDMRKLEEFEERIRHADVRHGEIRNIQQEWGLS